MDIAVIEECRASLQEPLTGPEREIVFDLSDVTFIDSSGLRFLIDAKNLTEARGKRLLLGHLSSAVLRLFELTGVMSWFSYA